MNHAILKNITVRADELSRQYEKTKDPYIKDQWFKLIRSVPLTPEHLEEQKVHRRI